MAKAPKAFGKAVNSHDGACTWPITDENRLRRFLMYGNEESSYYATTVEKDFTTDDAECINRLIAEEKGEEVVQRIIATTQCGNSAKPYAIVFALAMCARCSDIKTKQAAYRALSVVCQNPVQLFHFVNYAERLSGKSTGWGRAQRKAISDWYNDMDVKQLARAVTKYKQRIGWSHNDLIRLAHIKSKQETTQLVLRYVIKGLTEVRKEFNKGDKNEQVLELLLFLVAVDTVKHSDDEHQVARLIEQHQLYREHVPTGLLNSKEVWRALIQHMPLTELIDNLGKLASMGLLDALPVDSCAPTIVDRFKDDTAVSQAKLHPYSLLVTLKMYEQGKTNKGKLKWIPNGAVTAAISHMFYKSFKTLTSSKLNYLLVTDISTSVTKGGINGTPAVRPLLAVAAMSMAVVRSEASCQMVAICGQSIKPVRLSRQMEVQQVCAAISEVKEPSLGKTDASLPILWAIQTETKVDAIVILSDAEMEQNTLGTTMQKYRETVKCNEARLVVCSLNGTDDFAQQQDAGILVLTGFDTSTPNIIHAFAAGQL